MLSVIDLAWKVLTGLLLGRWVLAEALTLTRRVPEVRGEASVVRELSSHVGRRTRDLAVVRVELGDGSTAASAAYAFCGDADGHRRFEIGSVTKVLTGMLVADAIDRGELDLDTRVQEVLSALSGTSVGSVTVRELCTHTAGLPRLGGGLWVLLRGVALMTLGLNPYAQIGVDTLWRRAGRVRRRRGDGFRYSNFGAAIVGQLTAAAAEDDYGTLLGERILAPLGMSETLLSGPGAWARWGHAASGQRRQPWCIGAEAPAGGGLATIVDMAGLITALLDGTAPGRRSLALVPDVVGAAPHRRCGLFWVLQRDARGRQLS